MQWFADLMLKDKLAPTPAQAQQLQAGVSTPFFMTGKVAMELGNIGSLSQYATINEFEWGTAALPFPPDGSDRHMHVWIDFWSMIKGVKNLEGSWQFMKFMVGEEAQKIYPCEYGPQSALASLGQYWIDLQKKTLPNLSDDEFTVLTEASMAPIFLPSTSVSSYPWPNRRWPVWPSLLFQQLEQLPSPLDLPDHD